jgi:hypothetical protein
VKSTNAMLSRTKEIITVIAKIQLIKKKKKKRDQVRFFCEKQNALRSK